VKFISETCDHDHGTPGLLYSSDRVPDGQLVSRVTEATSAGVRCALQRYRKFHAATVPGMRELA
jgi:hypothetical protein